MLRAREPRRNIGGVLRREKSAWTVASLLNRDSMAREMQESIQLETAREGSLVRKPTEFASKTAIYSKKSSFRTTKQSSTKDSRWPSLFVGKEPTAEKDVLFRADVLVEEQKQDLTLFPPHPGLEWEDFSSNSFGPAFWKK